MENEDVKKDPSEGAEPSDTAGQDASFEDGGLFHTVELNPTSPSEPASKAEPGEDKPPADKDKEGTRENRRIRELVDENKNIKEELATLRNQVSTRQPANQEQPAKPNFKDISAMSDDELREWQEEDPKGYASNLAKQIAYENQQNLSNTMNENAIRATYASYAKSHPTFGKMWDTGEIQKFMQENPGHNAISAHQLLTSTKQTQAAVEDAIKKEREKWEKDLKLKGGISGLGSNAPKGGSAPVNDAAMKDSKKFGGTSSVLLARHNERVRKGMTSF